MGEKHDWQLMDTQLLQYIQLLTQRDRKSLTGKGLKTTAEAGELAEKILAYENAHTNTHKIVERRDVLEECADGMLCNMSIAFSLGFSEEELAAMLWQKAQKWNRLQIREEGVTFPLPFELHVTVEEAPNAAEFKTVCAGLGVKPIFLALQDNAGATVLRDVMTSSVVMGENKDALAELDRICAGLEATGYSVVRRKIESVPWHPAAPSGINGVSAMPAGGYFESHLNVLISASSEESASVLRAQLNGIAKEHSAHFSKNVFKAISPLEFTSMMTLRCYSGTREDFDIKRDALVQRLQAANFKLEKVISEFSLYDSKTTHDTAWLRS